MKRTLIALMAVVSAGAAAGEGTKALEAEFKATCQKMVTEKVKGTSEHVIGKEGWVVLTTELAYAASGPFWGEKARTVNKSVAPEVADPIPAILDFDKQLRAKGITLIFAPVPTRVVVYPEAILGKEKLAPFKHTPNLHSPERDFLQLLRSKGVRVAELTPLFLAKRADQHGPLFVPSDSHWTGGAIALAAAEIAKTIKRLPFYGSVPKQQYVVSWQELEHTGLVYKDLVEKAGFPEFPKDRVWVRSCRAKTEGGTKSLERRNPQSPVVVIGDSNLIWWQDQDSALFQQLSAEIGFPVDNLATTGGGATNTRLNFLRTTMAEEGYLAGKKVVVWCFSSRSFCNAGDGWKLVPLESSAAAAK